MYAPVFSCTIACIALRFSLLYEGRPQKGRVSVSCFVPEKDRERFKTLQKELARNLEMLFSSGSDVKMGAGYVLDYLGRAVAFSNNSYFKHSQAGQLGELKSMKDVPESFDALYTQILLEFLNEV